MKKSIAVKGLRNMTTHQGIVYSLIEYKKVISNFQLVKHCIYNYHFSNADRRARELRAKGYLKSNKIGDKNLIEWRIK